MKRRDGLCWIGALHVVSVSSRLISFSLTLTLGIIKPSNNYYLFHYGVFPLCSASQLRLKHIQERTKTFGEQAPNLELGEKQLSEQMFLICHDVGEL